MSAYADFLRTQGATEDDIKLLDTPVAQRAYDAQVANAKAAVDKYKTEVDEWHEKVAQPNIIKAQQDTAKATAEAARLRSLVAQSTDESLKQVAKDMGINVDGSRVDPNPNPNTPPSFDPEKFMTRESFNGIADRVGENIARLQDMVLEHMQLFPNTRLNVTALRAEARGGNVYEYWEKKYNVPAARDKQVADAKAADEARIRKDERDKVVAEFASQYANPGTVPATTSTNVFVPRPKAGREKQPWEVGLAGDEGSSDRVAHATKSFVERQASGRTN